MQEGQENEQKQSTEGRGGIAVDNEALFDQMKKHVTDLFQHFAVSMSDRPVPYNGEEAAWYLDPTEKRFPLREADGSVTTRQLKQVLNDIRAATDLSDGLRAPYATRVLALAHEYDVFTEDLQWSAHALMNFPPPTPESKTDPETGEHTETQTETHDPFLIAASDGTGHLFEFPLAAQDHSIDIEQNEGDQPSYLWRTVLRTGRWSHAPASGTPWNEGEAMVVTKDSLDMLKQNFDEGAIEYVTVPDTHPTASRENTISNRGFIKKLEVQEDPNRPGEHVLRAAFNFTNEEAKQAVLEGSIAGVSCGVKFDFVRKSDGKNFPAVLHHVALTNTPWIDGLGDWEKLAASAYNVDNLVIATEEKPHMAENEMTLEQSTQRIAELEAALRRANQEQMTQQVDALLEKAQKEKHIAPAVLNAMRPILLSAKLNESKVMMLSDSGDATGTEVSLAEQLENVLNAMPAGTDLTQPKDAEGKSIQADQQAPPKEAGEQTLSHEDKVKEIASELGIRLTQDS